MAEQTSPADTANAAMRRYWNEVAGPRWVERAEIQESRNVEVAHLVLREAHPAPGERVLDVGCGPGATTLPYAAAVGPTGHVTGIDISEPMLAVARSRVAERGSSRLWKNTQAGGFISASRRAADTDTRCRAKRLAGSPASALKE